jgi:hypothetical protein
MSQEVTNVKKFVSGIKSKPLEQPGKKKPKKKKLGYYGPYKPYPSHIQQDDLSRHIDDAEVVDPGPTKVLDGKQEIIDAEIVTPELGGSRKALTRGQRQITSGAKAIEAPRSRQFDGI